MQNSALAAVNSPCCVNYISWAKNKINLNVQNIKNLPTPTDGRRTYYYDTKVQGLGIMVFPSGLKHSSSIKE